MILLLLTSALASWLSLSTRLANLRVNPIRYQTKIKIEVKFYNKSYNVINIFFSCIMKEVIGKCNILIIGEFFGGGEVGCHQTLTNPPVVVVSGEEMDIKARI